MKTFLLIFVALSAVFVLNPGAALCVPKNTFDNSESHKKAALEENEETLYRIGVEQDELSAEIRHLDAQLVQIKAENTRLQSELDELITVENDFRNTATRAKEEENTLASVMRVMQKDLAKAIESSSLYPVYNNEKFDTLQDVRRTEMVPSLPTLTILADMAFSEIELASTPHVKEGTFVGRDGNSVQGKIITLGRFLNGYVTDSEAGYLWPSKSAEQMIAYPSLPEKSAKKILAEFSSGDSDLVSLDLSGGAAMAKFAQKSGISERVKEGGPLVWPILVIGLVAIVIIFERLLTILRSYSHSDQTMSLIEKHSAGNNWDSLTKITKETKPLQRVLSCAVNNRTLDRESLEATVHECLMREARAFERFLPTLGVLGAIAPLLGLLGTVTGMINTFQTITIYGTGDPRMMAGGISEALVTTMLGLIVAIPIMFFHNFLTRRSTSIVDDIEEKAVMVVNMIQRDQSRA